MTLAGSTYSKRDLIRREREMEMMRVICYKISYGIVCFTLHIIPISRFSNFDSKALARIDKQVQSTEEPKTNPYGFDTVT